ncbi:MAG: triose-phosphate isomerase [Alphaproteobacteria bacterium]|nr:triose-phosphate isomerase [Alphaproteobacteria bacterium]
MRKLAAGNWKMNGTVASLAEVQALIAAQPAPACEMLLCPPATLISAIATAAHGSALMVGAQGCHAKPSGAHTGDLSAPMLADAGASHVILGHSERRADHGETDAQVRAKAEAAQAAGLVAIVCVGETEAQRDAGETLAVIGAQIDGSVPTTSTAANLVIAYEPVWAIGTGRTPTLSQIAEVHAFLRARLADHIGAQAAQVRLLYGGSVKPSNAAEIFALPDVDGALVGGASLKAADFAPIVAALSAA